MKYKQKLLSLINLKWQHLLFISFLFTFLGLASPKSTFAATTYLEQYAAGAAASSEWLNLYDEPFESWAFQAEQATGAPNAVATCYDEPRAWSPHAYGTDPEWLQAKFATPVYATELTVYETTETGFITQIDLIDTSGIYHTIFTGSDNTASCPGEFTLSFPQTSYLVASIKVHTQIYGWEQIDAVKLTGFYESVYLPSPPLYSDTQLNLQQDITVNGITALAGQHSPSAAIDISANSQTHITTDLPALIPSSFPANPSGEHIHIDTSNSPATFEHSTDVYYHDIEGRGVGVEINLTGGGPYHLNELFATTDSVVINLSAGTYYIDQFEVYAGADNVTLNISCGPVILHIGTRFDVNGKNFKVNVYDNNVANFQVYLHNGAKFTSTDSGLDFTGQIDGPSNVSQVLIGGTNNSFHGAIKVSGAAIDITNTGTSFIYTEADQTAESTTSAACELEEPERTCGIIPATYPQYSTDKIEINYAISMNGNNVNSGIYSPNAVIDIDGAISTNILQTLPSLDPVSFPANNEANGHNHLEDSTTFSHSSDIYFNDIKAQDAGITINLTGGGPYHIAKLYIEYESVTLNLAAGIYYINEFNVNSSATDVTINATSGPVVLHIGYSFVVESERVNMNSGGNVEDLLVYLHDGAFFETKKRDFDFTGLVYGPSNVSKVLINGNRNSIRGAIIVGDGPISLQKYNFTHIYTPDDQRALKKITTCEDGWTGDTVATEFNCVENGADGITGKLYTKTTAQSFGFDIVALRDASTVENDFADVLEHTLTFELVNAETAASCDSYPALSPPATQIITMNSTNAGTKASASMASNTAYSTVKCRVTDTTDDPTVVGCSTDSFAVRPTSLTLSSNLNNTSHSGTPKAKTGEDFTLTATASAGYNGTPTINNSLVEAHSGAIQPGTLSGSFSTADPAAGIATGSTFNYSEVGLLRFTTQGIYDDSYTSTDQGSSDCTDDFSNTVVSGKVGCKFGNTANTPFIGRFTPDHFDVALNTPAFSPGCGNFTYIGQAVKYATRPIATITAKNSAGSTTQNYTSDFWKINPLDATYGVTPSYSVNGHSLVVFTSTAPSHSDSNNGSGTLTFADTSSDILAITKGALTAPFNAEIALAFTLSDTDGITVENVNGAAQTNPISFGATTTGNGIQFSNKNHRWGRATLSNAHGPELTPLSVPLSTEYYTGTSFIKNTEDNCTSFSLANNISISDAADFDCAFATQTSPVAISSGSVKASLSSSTVSSGETAIIISDNSDISAGPGTGNTGYIDITTKLDTLSWLNYDWNANSSHDNCPTAKATFGIYKGNDKIIYLREVY